VEIADADVEMSPVELPPLWDTDEPVRLPTLVSADDVKIQKDSTVVLSGMLLAGDDFEVDSDQPNEIHFTAIGPLASKDFYVHVRKQWDRSSDWWRDQWEEYWEQHEDSEDGDGDGDEDEDGIDNFAVWLDVVHDLGSAPQIRFLADDRDVRYHWQDPNEPIFVPAAEDDGLRWEVLEWNDNP
jgi:hypothetical protein